MSAAERHFILGTAGHVDHGKSALIRALTGVETDRLKEERARGISIELGFAEFPLEDGIVLGVVDVPGHERFVKQMVAGAGGVDLAFLVVAADEGVMPQTVEHLEILQSLGVRGGVIVITKSDLVDEEIAAVAAEEARDLVAGTFLEGRPVVAVSAVTGDGLDALRAAVLAEARALPARPAEGPFRLPVDRIFTMPGAGVIVTGTCWSGSVGAGDRLLLEPGGAKVRVRDVQAHGRPAVRGGSGQRLALALHGIKREDVERGDQVVSAGAAAPARRLDARITLVPHWRGVVKNRQRVHVHHAGREVLGRVVLLDREELGGDAPEARRGLVQIYLEGRLVAVPGDRLVLRFYSPVTTIAGGEVLACDPPRRRRFDAAALAELAVLEEGDPAALLRQRLREAGLAGLPAAEAAAAPEGVVVVGGRCYDADVLEAASAKLTRLVADYAGRHPLRLGVPREEARRRIGFPGGAADWNALCVHLAAAGDWAPVGDRLAAGPDGPPLPAAVRDAVAAFEKALRAAGPVWPGLDELAGALPADAPKADEFLRHLLDRGRAVTVAEDYFVHRDALADLAALLRGHFAGEDALNFATFRELTGLSRKLGIPMLEYLDQTGITRRDGDVRRAGPRLAAEAADA